MKAPRTYFYIKKRILKDKEVIKNLEEEIKEYQEMMDEILGGIE